MKSVHRIVFLYQAYTKIRTNNNKSQTVITSQLWEIEEWRTLCSAELMKRFISIHGTY